MIYLDNAATTRIKPEQVYEAFNYYVREIAVSPGRGSYTLGIEASRMLYKTRKIVGLYFGMEKPTNVVFTKNSTEAINLFFRGILNKGDHVVITCYEHNAVLRPLHKMKEEGFIDYTVITRDDLLLPPEALYSKYFRANTKVFASTLASNLTGRIIFSAELMKYLKGKGIITFLDSSQGAGKKKVDMQADAIDFLAFTGHKDLMALPGVGGLCCNNNQNIKPLIQGGTGILGDSYVNPDSFPEGLEAGTLNMPAIWALHAAIEYLNANWDCIQDKEEKLKEYLISRLKEIEKLEVYDEKCKRTGTMGVNLKGVPSDKLVQTLDANGICVRGGIHCAILAHEALGTVNKGIVRISLGYFNSKKDIDCLIEVLQRIGVE